MLTAPLYGLGVVRREPVPQRSVDRLAREALREEVTGGPRGRSASLDDIPGANELRLERLDRRLRRPAVDPVALEVEPDRGVALAAGGESFRACLREARVVEVAEAREGLERLGSGRCVDADPLEPLLDLVRRPIAMAERPRRELDRIRRLRHALHRSPQTAAIAASSSTGDTSVGAARGRSLAETICSGPACAWIWCRIDWTTSGCSLRNALAFWRPWPSRSSPKLKYEPDLVTILRSTPVSRTVPSQEIPS